VCGVWLCGAGTARFVTRRWRGLPQQARAAAVAAAAAATPAEQSRQSVPSEHTDHSDPAPPSSHWLSSFEKHVLVQAPNVVKPHRVPHAFLQFPCASAKSQHSSGSPEQKLHGTEPVPSVQNRPLYVASVQEPPELGGPQSVQSVPRLQVENSDPGPPSSQSRSFASQHVFEQVCVTGE
jgi:hypothetical protein